MTDAPPIIIDEDSAIDSAFFGSHAGRTCYARAHRSGWVLVVRQVVAQREPPVMLRVWGRVEQRRGEFFRSIKKRAAVLLRFAAFARRNNSTARFFAT